MTDDKARLRNASMVLLYLLCFPLYVYRVWKMEASVWTKIILTLLLWVSPGLSIQLVVLIIPLIWLAAEYDDWQRMQTQETCDEQIAKRSDGGWVCAPFEDVLSLTNHVGEADISQVQTMLMTWFDYDQASLDLSSVKSILFKHAQVHIHQDQDTDQTKVSHLYVLDTSAWTNSGWKDDVFARYENCYDLCVMKRFPLVEKDWYEIINPTVDVEYTTSWLSEDASQSEIEEAQRQKQEQMEESLGWTATDGNRVDPFDYRKGKLLFNLVPSTTPNNQLLLDFRDVIQQPFRATNIEDLAIVVTSDTDLDDVSVSVQEGFYLQRRSFSSFQVMIYNAQTKQLVLFEELHEEPFEGP